MQKMNRQKILLITVITITSLLLTNFAIARNFGVWGTVYPIDEENFTQFIYQRLKQMQQSGAYNKFKRQFIYNVKNHILRPKPVAGLTTTDHPQTYFYDPTFTLTRDIKTPSGKILFFKGTRINPLAKMKLREKLFFLNADDERQITWAQKKAQKEAQEIVKRRAQKYNVVKYILVNGNIKEASAQLNNRVYFDQNGFIAHKLGIKHIPCIVKQQGKMLQIKEFAVKNIETKLPGKTVPRKTVPRKTVEKNDKGIEDKRHVSYN